MKKPITFSSAMIVALSCLHAGGVLGNEWSLHRKTLRGASAKSSVSSEKLEAAGESSVSSGNSLFDHQALQLQLARLLYGDAEEDDESKSASEDQEDDEEKQRNLASLVNYGCDLIAEQFDGTVSCSCSLDYDTSNGLLKASALFDYSCEFSSKQCSGNVCTTPTFKGSIDLSPMSLKAELSNKVCLDSTKVSFGIFGKVSVGNFCVAATVEVDKSDTEITDCEVVAFSSSDVCSCSPCSSGTGVKVTCLLIFSFGCSTLDFPTAIKGTAGSISAFVPDISIL